MAQSVRRSARATRAQRQAQRFIREFYDRGVLWLFEDLDNLRDFLRLLIPELVDRLDFSRARQENRTLIPPDLRKRESDLIVSLPFLDQPERSIWLYLLLEHQSERDPWIGLRLLIAMVRLWEAQLREFEQQQTPISERKLRHVVPLVFYTGEGTWEQPVGLKHLMEEVEALDEFVPAWVTRKLDLQGTAPEALSGEAGAVGWALRVLQQEKAPLGVIEQALREAMAGLEELPDERVGQWLRMAWFLYLLVGQRRDERGLVDLVLEEAGHSKFREQDEVKTMGLPVFEQWKAEGAVDMLRSNLHRLLTSRFGPLPKDVEAAVARADSTALDAWFTRALTAVALTEVGIGGGDASV